jgi:hypothetical protein
LRAVLDARNLDLLTTDCSKRSMYACFKVIMPSLITHMCSPTDVIKFLRMLTFLPLEEVSSIEAAMQVCRWVASNQLSPFTGHPAPAPVRLLILHLQCCFAGQALLHL